MRNGDSVVHCTKPFATSPMIHLPADSDGASFRFYGGLTLPLDLDGAFMLWARDGSKFVPVDDHGKPVNFVGARVDEPSEGW